MSSATYTLRDIQSMLGISRSAINSLVAAGFVSPSRGKRQEYRFTFQDVVMLRTAHSLRAAQIPTRKILRSLRQLKHTLPDELPLTGLRITAAGNEIVVSAGDRQWQIESGQLLLDFEVKPTGGSVSLLTREREESTDDATCLFDLGARLEDENQAQAEAAYRRAISKAPDYVDPYLNLGCMLCDAGRCEEAVALYRAALEYNPREPLLHFNLAIALEDMKRMPEALSCYETCLQLSPQFADAHYNAALLCESLGHASKAIRHFSAFRRLEKKTK